MASSSRGNPAPAKFTPEMQDRQARNKNPYTGNVIHVSTSDEENGGGGGSGGGSSSPPSHRAIISAADDAYESRQKRRWAASILNSAELLQLHALARNDSVPGTRQHFTKILCGYEDVLGTGEKRTATAAAAAAAAKREKEKEKERRPLSKVIYRPFTGAFEL